MSIDLKNSIEKPNPKHTQKRYYGIDSCKGFGIWVMVIIHCVLYQGMNNENDILFNTIEKLSFWFYPLLLVPLFLSLWGPLFMMMTCLTVSIQMLNVLDSYPKKAKEFLRNRFLGGVLIITISKIIKTLASAGFFKDGGFVIPEILIEFDALPLDLVAWSSFLVPCFIWLLYQGFKIKNPYFLISILMGMIIVWISITPLLYNLGDIIIPWLESKNLFFLSYIVHKFIRGRFCLFPSMTFGFLGAIFGIMLHKNFKIQKIVIFILINFGICIIGFAFWYFTTDSHIFQSLTIEYIPIEFQIINLGCTPFHVMLFLKNQDFAENEKTRVRAAKRTTWLRRYSLLSLTIFTLDVVLADLIIIPFVNMWGPTISYSTMQFSWNFWQIFLFILVVLVIWGLIMRLWEKIDFTFSVEWFLVKIMQKITGHEMERIHVRHLIHTPNDFRLKID